MKNDGHGKEELSRVLICKLFRDISCRRSHADWGCGGGHAAHRLWQMYVVRRSTGLVVQWVSAGEAETLEERWMQLERDGWRRWESDGVTREAVGEDDGRWCGKTVGLLWVKFGRRWVKPGWAKAVGVKWEKLVSRRGWSQKKLQLRWMKAVNETKTGRRQKAAETERSIRTKRRLIGHYRGYDQDLTANYGCREPSEMETLLTDDRTSLLWHLPRTSTFDSCRITKTHCVFRYIIYLHNTYI